MSKKPPPNKSALALPGVVESPNTIFDAIGIAGDHVFALLAFVVIVSCQLAVPLGLVVAGQSSVGKSFIIRTILKYLIPAEWWAQTCTSKISPAVLPKFPVGHFKHKVMFLDESEGKDEAVAYIVRILQSEGKYRYWVTGKDGKAKEEMIEGPTGVIETTSDDLHRHKEDNLNRTLIVHPDESKEQTARVLQRQAEMAKNPDRGVEPPECATIRRALKVLRAYPVVTPYADLILPKTRRIQDRRDFPKILGVIEVIAVLRQGSKQKLTDSLGATYIEADLRDYELAYPLLEYAFNATVTKINVLNRYLEMLRVDLTANSKKQFTQRDFERITGLARTRTKLLVKEMVEHQLITVAQSARSTQPAIYEAIASVTASIGYLVTPEELRAAMEGPNTTPSTMCSAGDAGHSDG